MPSADLSPHLPGCRYGRSGTVSRDPIRVFVSYFWVVPAWSFHRNWCLEVIRFACSSSSTLLASYLSNAYPLRLSLWTRYLFIPVARRRVKKEGYSRIAFTIIPPSSPGHTVQDIHFSDWFFFYRYFGTFTILFLCPRCDLWPVSHASPWTLGRPAPPLANKYFLRDTRGRICRDDDFCRLFICVPLAAFAIAGFRQIDFECFVMSFFG